MKKLHEIVEAVRLDEQVGQIDLAHAIVALDELLKRLDLQPDTGRMAEYFKAFESVPIEYFGRTNSPAFVAYSRLMLAPPKRTPDKAGHGNDGADDGA